MNKLSDASHFLDLGSFDALRSKAQKDEASALKEVAQQFEGIFVQMLMKSMRDANAVFESDSPMNSQYTQFYEQMHDQQMSLNLSSQGMLGLSDLMVQQLSPEASQMLPASVLRADNNTPGFIPNAHIEVSVEQQGQFPLASNLLDKLAIGEERAGSSQLNVAMANHQTAINGSTDPNTLTVFNHLDLDSTHVSSTHISRTNDASSMDRMSKPFQISSPEAFVAKLYPDAQVAATKLGIQAEVLIAQSALETGWGQKMIRTQDGSNSHNLFNIKTGQGWQGKAATVDTLEFEQGKMVKQQAQFRVYDDFKQSFNDFVDLLTQGDRYQAAIKQADDPKAFIEGLQAAGYATDPQYAKKVIRVLQSITQDLLPKGVLK